MPPRDPAPRPSTAQQCLRAFLRSVPNPSQALVVELDSLVRRAAPDLESSLKWGNLTYHGARNVCALVSHRQHVNLQLFLGAGLDDPRGLLRGTGRQMRHVRFVPGEPFDRRTVAALVKAAVVAGEFASGD